MKETYTIRLAGHYYACIMPALADAIINPETSAIMRRVRTVADRNAAIMATCRPLRTWREAYDIARSAGNYSGMLYSDETGAFRTDRVEKWEEKNHE